MTDTKAAEATTAEPAVTIKPTHGTTAPRAARMPWAGQRDAALVIGGEPRVDLLPVEVRQRRSLRVLRKRLVLAVVAGVVLVMLATGGATTLSLGAQAQLAAAQARGQSLLQQQGKYSEVTRVQRDADAVKAARKIGMASEIDWQQYLRAVQGTLPKNVTLDTVMLDSTSPLVAYAQPTAPLQGARVATLSFTATSPTLPDVPAWLTALAGLPGYADAVPGSVTHDDTTGKYQANITMHINSDAFANRFTGTGK